MAENPATPPKSTPDPKKTPERLLASFVRPAFHGLKVEGKKDRGTATKPVDADATAATLPSMKRPGSPPPQPKPVAQAVEVVPQAPEPGDQRAEDRRANDRRTVDRRQTPRRIATTRLPSRSAAALRDDPNHVYEPHLHKRHTGGYAGIFIILVIGFGFLAYTFGLLPLDQLFDQGNAAVQSHNDQLVAWITHVAPIVGVAFAVLMVVVLLRRVFFSED